MKGRKKGEENVTGIYGNDSGHRYRGAVGDLPERLSYSCSYMSQTKDVLQGQSLRESGRGYQVRVF